MKYVIYTAEYILVLTMLLFIVYTNETSYTGAFLWVTRVLELIVAWQLGFNSIKLHNKLWKELS